MLADGGSGGAHCSLASQHRHGDGGCDYDAFIRNRSSKEVPLTSGMSWRRRSRLINTCNVVNEAIGHLQNDRDKNGRKDEGRSSIEG